MDNAWRDAWNGSDDDTLTVVIRDCVITPDEERERIDPPGGPIHTRGDQIEVIIPPADEENEPDG